MNLVERYEFRFDYLSRELRKSSAAVGNSRRESVMILLIERLLPPPKSEKKGERGSEVAMMAEEAL